MHMELPIVKIRPELMNSFQSKIYFSGVKYNTFSFFFLAVRIHFDSYRAEKPWKSYEDETVTWEAPENKTELKTRHR